MSCISQRVRYDLYKILCQPRDKVLYLEYSFCLFIRPGFLIWIGWQICGICETDYLTGWMSFLLSKQQLGMWRKLFLVTALLLFFLPSLLWCCCLDSRKSNWPVKNWVVACWHGKVPLNVCMYVCCNIVIQFFTVYLRDNQDEATMACCGCKRVNNSIFYFDCFDFENGC